jgi:hypothetical protein
MTVKSFKPHFFIIAICFLIVFTVFQFKSSPRIPPSQDSQASTSPYEEPKITVYSADKTDLAYSNEVLKVKFDIPKGLAVKEYPGHFYIESPVTNEEIARVKVEQVPSGDYYSNFTRAAESTFKYWSSSTSQFDAAEKISYSKQQLFKARRNGRTIDAYRYLIYLTGRTEVWLFIPQPSTTEPDRLKVNAVDFVWISYDLKNEAKISPILDSLNLF